MAGRGVIQVRVPVEPGVPPLLSVHWTTTGSNVFALLTL